MTVDLADIPDLSFSLDQVPLGVQVVDWPGLAASTIPQVSPAYPNDVYAVLAGLQAWNRNDPVKPQVLQSDGQHALRVRVVNPGAGGFGPSAILQQSTAHTPLDQVYDTAPATEYDAALSDPFGYYDPLQPTKLTVPVGQDGFYLAGMESRYNVISPAPRDLTIIAQIFKNGTGSFHIPSIRHDHKVPKADISGYDAITMLAPIQLVAGDYLEVYQTGDILSSELFVYVNNSYPTLFWLSKIA